MTPSTPPSADAPPTPVGGETASLDVVGELQHLKSQITAVQAENERLKSRLRERRMPDDFASAVSHSIDTIQSRLSGLSNPVTDFAVREFSIEAKVSVSITPLGTVEYRFVQPGDNIDPAALSRISMTVVPIPKQTQAGAWVPEEFTPRIGVEEIPGVGDAVRDHFNQQGIFTLADLLHAGSRVRSSVELASLLEVDRSRLSEWLSHAELLTVRDIDGVASGVLYELGVRSLADLAAERPDQLAARYNDHLVATSRKQVPPIDAARAASWISAARSYVGRQVPISPPRAEPQAPQTPPPTPAPAPQTPPPTTQVPPPTSPPPQNQVPLPGTPLPQTPLPESPKAPAGETPPTRAPLPSYGSGGYGGVGGELI